MKHPYLLNYDCLVRKSPELVNIKFDFKEQEFASYDNTKGHWIMNTDVPKYELFKENIEKITSPISGIDTTAETIIKKIQEEEAKVLHQSIDTFCKKLIAENKQFCQYEKDKLERLVSLIELIKDKHDSIFTTMDFNKPLIFIVGIIPFIEDVDTSTFNICEVFNY